MKKKKICITLIVVIAFISLFFICRFVHISRTYDRAVDLVYKERYEYALELFEDVPKSYKKTEKYVNIAHAHYCYDNADWYVYHITHAVEEYGISVEETKLLLFDVTYLPKEDYAIREFRAYVEALFMITKIYVHEDRNFTKRELQQVVSLLESSNGYGISQYLINQVKKYNEFKVYDGVYDMDGENVEVTAKITFIIESNKDEALTEEKTCFAIETEVDTQEEHYIGVSSVEEATTEKIKCVPKYRSNPNDYDYILVDLKQNKVFLPEIN